MRPETYQALAQRQRTYWWHRARRATALALLQRYGLKAGSDWLDLGCGPGGNFTLLDPLHPKTVAGVDVSPVALSLAREHAPNALLERADVNERLPFADASFDLVTIFNVLYHEWVRSESAVLAEVARVLRPGGLLLLTEPAFDRLRREMDDAVMTRRRYRLSDFDPWLRKAGLRTLFSSYFTSFGVPILLGAKFVQRFRKTPAKAQDALDMRPVSEPVNRTFSAIAGLEGWLLTKGLRMPFGTTLMLIARREGSEFTPRKPRAQ